MVIIGTPFSSSSTRLMLLGSGELGKEVAIEAQRLGIEVIAVDRYENAPAMQIAHRSHVISMLDGDALAEVINLEQPHFVVPEVEAIATDTLIELERTGVNVIPTARATRLTMDRDYEITLLTIRSVSGTSFCDPIGHLQIDGDYRESWQPHPMNEQVLSKAQDIARDITSALGGWGLFGVELFVMGDTVIFSEVSPRPHDTGMVTLISQNYSEFALHIRAILGLPLPQIHQLGPSASCALVAYGDSNDIRFDKLGDLLLDPEINIRLFGKPVINGHRRLGVALSLGHGIEDARDRARRASDSVRILLD